MALLIPSWLDLTTWAGVLFASLALIGFGRLLSAGRAAPESALVAGWGGAVLLLTLWGVAVPLSLRGPALVVALAGALGLVLPGSRLSRAEWLSLWRLVVLASPFLAVMASARPSLPDTFLNLLPDAAYLYDHGGFPADGLAAAHSFLPAAPYNLQLAAYIVALVTPDFPASAMIGLNLLLQLATGLLLARLVAGREASAAAPGWSATAGGLLLALALNPGFVPRYHLSAYSEPSVAVTLAFAGWHAARLVERRAAGRSAGREAWLLALTLAALVNIKQDSIALAVAVVISAACLSLLARQRALGALALAAVPAAVLYLAWRWYVLTHFALGELKPLPAAQWQFAALPLILWHILGAMVEKITFFATLAAVFGVLAARLRRQGLTLATRAAALLLGVFLIYNAALLFAYIAHFPGAVGADAHSYFRYNTHLALLLMVAIALLARETPAFHRWIEEARVRRLGPTALIVVALLSPVAFLKFLRFDLEVPQSRVWLLARAAAPRVADGDKLALVLPGDNGSVATMLEGLLRLTPPRRPDLVLTTLTSDTGAGLRGLAVAGYRLALLSCAPPGIAGVAAGEAALLAWHGDGWQPLATWSYPPAPRHGHWSKVLSDAPLCLPG